MFTKMKKDDMINKVFNKLTVIERVEKGADGRKRYLCRCECGVYTNVRGKDIKSGNTKSCGCIAKKRAKNLNKKYRNSGKRVEYTAWKNMVYRCYNNNSINYHSYGGRGIKVCERWLESFDNFYEDMGERPSSKHQLDRINNNDNYKPDNCRWILAHQNANNRRVKEDWGVSRSSTGKYYALMERQQVRRNGKSVKDKEDALKLRDSWLKEYEENPELWIEKTLNKTYDKS